MHLSHTRSLNAVVLCVYRTRVQSWHELRLSESYGQTMPVGYALVEPVQDSLINWHVGETETDARPGTADSGGELCLRVV